MSAKIRRLLAAEHYWVYGCGYNGLDIKGKRFMERD